MDPPLLYESEIQKLREIVEPENANMVTVLKGVIQDHTWVTNEHVCQVLQGPLTRLCARYLYMEKRRRYALNPVGKCDGVSSENIYNIERIFVWTEKTSLTVGSKENDQILSEEFLFFHQPVSFSKHIL